MTANINRLNRKRREIDQIDKRILFLLDKRIKTIKEIQAIKKELDMDTHDPKRERELLKRAEINLKKKKHKKIVMTLYREILLQSLNFLKGL